MTPDEIVREVYAILSGRADEPRDWARFRTFYHPQARMMPVRDGVIEIFDVDGYITSRTPMLARADFYERELSSDMKVWGSVAHVLSEYDSRRTPDGDAFVVGMNSFQFVNDGTRWLITSATWDVTGA